MERIVQNTDWFIFAWLLSLILIAVAKILNEKKFSEYITVLIDKKFILTGQREENFLINKFNIGLLLSQLITFSLFYYLALVNLTNQKVDGFLLFVKILIILTGFVVLKFLLEKVIGGIVGIGGFVNEFNFIKLTYRNYSALVFTGINLILYKAESLIIIYIFLAIGIYLIFNLVGFIRMFNLFQNQITSHIFYFILYLCALEIAPYVILYKILLD